MTDKSVSLKLVMPENEASSVKNFLNGALQNSATSRWKFVSPDLAAGLKRLRDALEAAGGIEAEPVRDPVDAQESDSRLYRRPDGVTVVVGPGEYFNTEWQFIKTLPRSTQA